MELILLENIGRLGKIGDLVNVKPGYARNFLLPLEKAVRATAANKEAFEQQRAELEQRAAEQLNAAEARHAILDGMILEIQAKTSNENKLFGSIGAVEISEALNNNTKTTVAKKEVLLSDGPIRQLGEYTVALHLHSDVRATVTVIITAES